MPAFSLIAAAWAAFSDITIGQPEEVKVTEFSPLLQGIIRIAFLAAVVFAFIFLLWGGIQWILSGGDKEKYDQAKNKIVAALVGMAIVALAWLIIKLVTWFFGLPDIFGTNQPFKFPKAYKDEEPLPSVTSLVLKNNLPLFASWQEEEIDITPSVPEYTLKSQQLTNLTDIEKAVGNNFSSEQLSAFTSPGFFIVTGKNKLEDPNQTIDFQHLNMIDEFLMNYQDIMGDSMAHYRKPENTVFITSDLLLHSYHVFIERTFEHIEETKFQPQLLKLTDLLYQKSLAEYVNASNSQIKGSWERLTTFFLVPKVILETSKPKEDKFFMNPDEEQQTLTSDQEVDKSENILSQLEKLKGQLPDKIYQTARAEIELINRAEGAAVSPLFGPFSNQQLSDYTQFKPRSHYTKSSILRSYWKAMIWFGRNGFLVKSDELTLDAITQTILLNSLKKDDQSALQIWENIYLPTVFFVGKSDDLTVYDYQKIISEVYGDNPNFSDLPDQNKFNQFKNKVKELLGPTIQSSIILVQPGEKTEEELLEETKSWRFMGQRFIPDSFIFSSLTQGDTAPDPETGQKLPPTPTALMPMSIFKSERAQFHLEDWIKDKAPKSDKVIPLKMNQLKNFFEPLALEDWTQNLYWSWLYTLKSLFNQFGQGYPMFMQNKPWNDKDLNSSLGSWTELRHDTLLYAKQSYAELGAGGEFPEPPPVPKGYVEPNLTFLNRIIALAQMTQEGLEKYDCLPEEQKWKLEQLIDVFKFYREIAKKELTNQIISEEEFEKLRISPVSINRSLTPATGSFITAEQARAGLIADVHTAITMEVEEILYEATGIPSIIYVAVKDTNGTRLTRGVVYSYYEFTRPFGERLSDADWQAVVYEDKDTFPLPDAPSWVKDLEK